jgi:hypothetical protein
MFQIKIKALDNLPKVRLALSEMLVDIVASDGLVSFLHPLAIDDTNPFWELSHCGGKGGRIVLDAFNGKISLVP